MNFSDLAKSLLHKGASATAVDTLAGTFGGKGIKRTKARAVTRYAKRNMKQNNASLASVSSLSVLDPVGIYDASLRRYDGMDTIMQMSLIIIMGYVLRAIPFLAERTRGKVITVLSQLSPSASLQHTYEKLNNLLIEEAYEFGLPTITTEVSNTYSRQLRGSKRRSEPNRFGLKSDGKSYGKQSDRSSRNTRDDKRPSNASRRAMLTGRASGLTDANDFSIGKNFEIEIPIGRNDTQKVPLTMILQARSTEYETLKSIGEGGSPSRSWLERWIKFSAGSSTITELITQGDLVSKDVKAAMRDKSGVHAEIMRRKMHGKVATTFGGEVRYGIGSNLLITSLSTTERLMRDLRFDISDYRQRQKIMGAFSCLLWVVVDKEEDYLINYYRDIRLPSEVSLAAVKRLVKSGHSSDQITEALRSLSANRAPTI